MMFEKILDIGVKYKQSNGRLFYHSLKSQKRELSYVVIYYRLAEKQLIIWIEKGKRGGY